MKKKLFIFAATFSLALVLQCAWHFHFFPFKASFARIPVKFTVSQIPYAEIEIEKKKYLLDIDLGANCDICLNKKTLEKISEKKLLGKTLSYDIRGNEYESNLYAIPKIQMGKVQIRTCPVEEESPRFLYNANIWNPRKDSDYVTSGRIGSKMAQKSPLLLDFNNSVFFLVRNRESLKDLSDEGYFIDTFFEIPFHSEKGHIIFTADTNIGKKRFLLDTGASVTVIKPTSATEEELQEMREMQVYMTTSKFVMGGHDFGEMDLLFFDFSDKFDHIDGCLGMDFCKKHVIYLDFKEKKALISPVEKVHPFSK
jgi:hypothetical protein